MTSDRLPTEQAPVALAERLHRATHAPEDARLNYYEAVALVDQLPAVESLAPAIYSSFEMDQMVRCLKKAVEREIVVPPDDWEVANENVPDTSIAKRLYKGAVETSTNLTRIFGA